MDMVLLPAVTEILQSRCVWSGLASALRFMAFPSSVTSSHSAWPEYSKEEASVLITTLTVPPSAGMVTDAGVADREETVSSVSVQAAMNGIITAAAA